MTPRPSNIAYGSDNAAASVVPETGEEGAAPEAGRRKRGEELEQAIRSATVEELAVCGYGELSIESVAARAQTGKASIYRRWPTKQELVTDAMVGLCTGPLAFANEALADDDITTREALRHLILRIAALMTGPSSAAMRAVWSEAMRDSLFAETIQREFFAPRRATLEQLLARGVARGEVRPDVRADHVHDALGGGLSQRILLRGERPTEADLEAFLDGFVMPAIELRNSGGRLGDS